MTDHALSSQYRSGRPDGGSIGSGFDRHLGVFWTAMLDIIWEDPHGLAINKPAGLLTHPARIGSGEPTVEAIVRQYLRPADPASVYLGTVHRLDRPVSGLILWAKTTKAAQRWANQFRERRVRKEYWALVEQQATGFTDGVTLWDDWLSRPDRLGRAHLVGETTPGAVRAITRVEPGDQNQLLSGASYLWLKLYPETGRTHQLRVQAAARGWPIIGDATYGSQVPFPQGIGLHARSLTIEHPVRHLPMTLTASLPNSWSPLLAQLG